MSSRPKVGYVYTPPSDSNNYVSDIMEWVGYPQFEFDSVKSSFLKVAYIQEYVAQTSRMEVVFSPVYVNINDFAMSQQTAFIVPKGWKKKVVKSDEPTPTLNYSAGFVVDDFMSAISSLSEGIWTNNNTTSVLEAPSSANSTGINLRQHSPTPATLSVFRPSAPLTYRGSTLLHTSFIPPPILIETPDVPLAEGHYILCDPKEFHDGIKHTQEYLDTYFFTASVCIQDAKTWAKHYLHIYGLEPNQTYKNRCIRAIEEMVTISKSCGQAVEKGLQCSQTGEQKDLDILNAIGLVTGERDALMKGLKSHSAAYIDKSDRASIGGYSLQSKPPTTIANYINGLTGLTTYNSMASSIDFTRDTNGRAYRRLPILIFIAQRLLRPVDNSRDASLLDLFLDDYKEIPEQLILVVCAMYIVMFKRRLVLNPGVLHSVDVREEAVRQLHLLRIVRGSSSDEAVELNAWITTRDGQHGWLAALQNALTLANGLRGPPGRSSELA